VLTWICLFICRALGGIPSLIELLNNELPEVHKNASGALRNLSFGKNNDENKVRLQKHSVKEG
jgi:hypothetical protein